MAKVDKKLGAASFHAGFDTETRFLSLLNHGLKVEKFLKMKMN